MTSNLRIQEASASHVGHVRAVNEDSLTSILDDGVWVVADGMGGHFDGRFASQTIVDMVTAEHYPNELDSACDPFDEELEALRAAEPQTPDDMSRAVIAHRLLRERSLVLARLRRLGVFIVDAPADKLGPELVRAYDELRRRERI